MITYSVLPSNPSAHLFTVVMHVPAPDPSGQILSLPAWIPGSYLVREFSKNLVQVHAQDDDGPVALDRIDKHTWAAPPCSGALVVTCQVYAWDLSVRMAHLDQLHGYFNGTSLFLKAHGFENEPHRVELLAPLDPQCQGWRVATTLARAEGTPEHGFGWYQADSHDELIDHPVEMGTWEGLTFTACGVPHEVAITGVTVDLDRERLLRDLTRICEHHIRFFEASGQAPMDRYLFGVMVVGSGYGGLEHRASTSLICKRDDLPRVGTEEVTEGYRQFLGLCSHEYFHTWNVKRIKPAAFLPYDLNRESYTTLLWAFEGITSYYDDLALLRTRRIDLGSWLELVGRTLTRVRRGSGRSKQSLAESSFYAWTKFYRQDENAANAIVSYYAKGSLAALALDLVLFTRSDGRVRLDDVMRALWERHGKPLVGVPEEGIEALAQELSGLDLSDFFDATIRGTGDIPVDELLAPMGLALQWRPAKGASDKGGTSVKDLDALRRRADLGAKTSGRTLKAVYDGGAAQLAGLSAGDEIVAVDGLKVSKVDDTLSTRRPGTTVHVHAFRRDELIERDVVLQGPPESTCWIEIVEPENALRDAWLAVEPEPDSDGSVQVSL